MKSEAYLNEIRKSEGLRRAVLKKLTIERTTVTFHLITDVSYTEEDVAYARSISEKYVPDGFKAQAHVIKSVPSEEGVRAVISQILREKFPASAAFLSPENVEVALNALGGRFYLSVSVAERRQFAHGDVINELSRELMRRFCGTWSGDYRQIEREEMEIEREAPPPAELIAAPRTFEIAGYLPIDGAGPRLALYCADLSGEQQNVTVCGVVTHIEERMTKKEKPYFRITISDGSGQASASYFSKKATLEKVRAIKSGMTICLTGSQELFHGSYTFTAKSIDLGAPPEGFVPVSRSSRPAPYQYLKVIPEEIGDPVQETLFEGKPFPEEFLRERFVVFDLETTGLNNNPVGAAMDRIIEIGAVKIIDGKICEKFSSFVACPVRLSGEIVALTGITDEMLLGAPEIKEVIADFFKFCEGSRLVGHNVQFDYKFVRHYGEAEGYLFDHRQYDTVTFSQELLHLSNYKLNTVADHFGFTFQHHRAFDDAFVTAKIFLELVRMKGGLPNY